MLVGKEGENGAPRGQRAIEGELLDQRELVVNHAGNLYWLTGKFRGREARFECRLHSRVAQDLWTTRRVCRNYFAGLIKDHFY